MDEKNEYIDFLKKFESLLPARPKAIVFFSAHFESQTQIISCPKKFDTIYDFYGFPEKYYKMKYPAEGDPKVAAEVQALLKENGIETKMDTKRGLDHGAWTILMLMYPKADIPIVSMSVNPYAPHEELYNIGKALAPLKEKGVLIIGSGSLLHNFNKFRWNAFKADDWAVEFSEWMNKRILDWNTKELYDYRKLTPLGKVAAPSEEHFVPYLYPMGAGDKAKKPVLLHNQIVYGGMLYALYKFEL